MLVFGENILDLWNEHERGFIIFDIILDVSLSWKTKYSPAFWTEIYIGFSFIFVIPVFLEG